MAFVNFKKDRYILLLLIASHLLWFLAAVFIWQKPYSYDSVEYMQLATNLKNGLYYSGNAQLPITEHYITLRPPVYSIFILLSWTLWGYQTWIILLFQNIISIATCLLVRNTFLQLFPEQKRQTMYWLLILLYPMQMVFANMIFCDVLFQFFLMLYLRQLLLFLKDGRGSRFWWMTLWLIAGVFTKPILYPFLFLHALAGLFYTVRLRKKGILVAAAIPLCLILLYGFYNEKRTGLFHISSVQSYNLLEYNVSEFYQYKYGTDEAKRRMAAIQGELASAKNFPERYRLSARIAKQKIGEDLLSYSLFHVRKSIQLFFDPNKLEFDIFSRRFHYINNYQESFSTKLHSGGLTGAWEYLKSYPFLLLLLITPLTGVFRLLGTILFVFDRRISISLRIAVAVFVAYFALITGPVANARYFLPILMVTSACSWISFANLWRKRKLKISQKNVAIQ
jgi:hypothetical protein